MDKVIPMCPRVLVTRPTGQHQNLCDLLRKVGTEPVHFPVIAIEPLTPPAPNQDPDWLIFISANAVRHGHGWVSGNAKLAAVGEKTARALQQTVNRPVRFPPTDFTSEGLLALPEFQTLENQSIAIVRGQGGRETLAETLRSRGAKVDYWEVYARRLPKLAAPPNLGRVDAVTLTSVEAARNLFALLPNAPWLRTCRYAVFSPRIAHALQQLGVETPPRVAARMCDAGLVEALGMSPSQ